MEEITYDLILKYLTKEKNIFITEKHKNNNNFLNKFESILTSDYYRYGVSTFDDKKNNISFWTSLLTLLNDDYILNSDDFSLISEYKNSLIDSHSKKISSFLKKYEKNDFREYFKLNPDIIIIQYVVDILNINIIIFDLFENENIYAVYKNDVLNPNNDTIILANYQNYWEPIMKKDKKKFNYDDDIIKIILNHDVKYYSQENINKKFSFSLNSNKNIKKKTTNNLILSSNSSDISNIETKNLILSSNSSDIPNIETKNLINEDINISKNKLERTKKIDLIKILDENNIEYPTKNTNKDLIELIIKNKLEKTK
jgi:hypothetical protein